MLQLTELIGFGVGDSGLPQINLVMPSDIGVRTEYNIRTRAIAAGWDGSSQVRVNLTIPSGIRVRSSGGGSPPPALRTGSPWPAGSEVHITNEGSVYGAGGAGALSPQNGSRNGAAGGDAFRNDGVPCFITNNGTFAGGGGGGGAGQDRTGSPPGDQIATGGPGGGGQGDAGGSSNAGDGSPTSPGSGGAGQTSGALTAGTGGTGGTLGNAGNSGGTGTGGSSWQAPGSGGAAGRYATGNSNNTWLVNGTRLGGVSSS